MGAAKTMQAWTLFDDPSALGHLAMGGAGCISVTANVAPALCAQFQAALAKGDYKAALALSDARWKREIAESSANTVGFGH